ncbi:type II secretion system F family protein [Granulicella paludicola]|uniref:type II secretion system F family protein n=1 Tax=Granulicella paludicola TaxID=474951 RepID=UPI0021E02E3E|nr:type II secretion system F family protein [Granulicella paludicola]
MLFLLFLLLALITFGLVISLTRPTKDEVRVQKRLSNLRSNSGDLPQTDHRLEEFLAAPGSHSFEWLEDIFSRATSTEKFRRLLVHAGSEWSTGTLLFLWLAILLVVFAIVSLSTHMTLIAIAAAAAASSLPFLYLNFKSARRVQAFSKALPDSIEMIVRALRAGYSIVAAIQIAGEQSAEPAKTEFAEVYKKQNYGLPLRDALLEMLDRMPSPDLRVLVTGILVQKDTGGNLAELLERISAVIRERVRIQGEVRVHTAQGRMTGWILCLLPVGVMIALNLISPGYSTPLFTDSFGQKMLYTGVALLLIGAFTIRKIVNGIEV